MRPDTSPASLKPYLSPLGAWALALGCAVGWGAFVMPGTTFLPIAGPVGTALGMAIGAVVMLIIGVNFNFMMNRCPDAGGPFAYTNRVFGYDHGYLVAWVLFLVYVAVVWANATALPLICRNLLGSTFQFGLHYQIAGYDVYLGEALLSLAALWGAGLLCIRSRRGAAVLQILLALILLIGVTAGFALASSRSGGQTGMDPPFVPGKSPAVSVFNIVALAPWAFVGFESISHSVEEYRFSTRRTLLILFLSLVAGAAVYICLSLLAVTSVPAQYGSWLEYIADLGNLSGLEGLPTFHSLHALLGQKGVVIFVLTVLGGVLTGLVGNSIAASRLIYAAGREGLLPPLFSALNKNHSPRNAFLFILLVSSPIPFLGRTAIGWIVDVTTVGATIAYVYVSACAWKSARSEKYLPAQITGILGMVISLLFFLYFLVPNFLTVSALTTESYLILIVWSILGFIFFRYIFRWDKDRRFGRSTVVWIVLIFFVFFSSVLWLREATQHTTETVVTQLSSYNTQELAEHGVVLTEEQQAASDAYIQKQLETVNHSLTRNSIIQMSLILISLFILFNIYSSMMEREKEMELRRLQAEERSRAKTTFLSNMSHDIRTPMNAIIGYSALAKKEPDIPPKVAEYLDKIGSSSDHLLNLINDILELSRIESGRMELDVIPTDLFKVMDAVRDLFNTQMETKGLDYIVSADQVTDALVLCDPNRLNRVLLNLISNAYKFTPAGGQVRVTLTQTGSDGTRGSYVLRVRDTGMGMSPEFAARVFEAYERERSASGIQGTGLGMAITKNIVDLMGGDIQVESVKGEGTEFTIQVDFPLDQEAIARKSAPPETRDAPAMDFSRFRLLLVEDNEINIEIAILLLTEAGFQLDTAENGRVALEKVTAAPPDRYQAILMDVQMPEMNGYEATRAIRALPDPVRAGLPIIAMTANAFAEDIQAAREAGMNSHIAKPIDVTQMIGTLTEVLQGTDQARE